MGQGHSRLMSIVRIVSFAGAGAGLVATVTMAGELSVTSLALFGYILVPFGLVVWAIDKRSMTMTGVLWLLAGSGFGLAAYGSVIWPTAHVSSTAGVALLIIPILQTLWCLPAVALSRVRSPVERP